MKFKIELEAVSPKEKALTPILKIHLSSDNAAPQAIIDTLDKLTTMIWSIENTMNSLETNKSMMIEKRREREQT